ncbi:MAG: sugar ABC transporter ATP-binding protein [Sphaerochaetaceae bacterium]|jgi:ABC-type sugar transport system ATPase subunit|nr:sugar ABC transporter ATP-binding protein [Sphaerochaetaceae bacterium]
MNADTILDMQKISKHFGGVIALHEVDFSCRVNEIHCIAGENGAGKSTLLKIISGLLSADHGQMFLHGKEVQFKSPHEAQKHGIAMVYQELTLIPELTVEENIFLNIEPKNRFSIIDRKKVSAQLAHLMQEYDIELAPKAVVKTLSIAQQQMTEILKILVRNPNIIILDEPTSALAQGEVEKLFHIMRTMKERGKTLLFISHRLDEIFSITDRVTVLKDSRLVGTYETKDLDHGKLIRAMVGRSLTSIFPKPNEIDIERTVFAVESFSVGNKVKDVSFSVYHGEVVGIAGLQGHGQTELLNGIAALMSHTVGKIFINGEQVVANTPWDAIRAGIALVPVDRKTEGLLLELSVKDNLALASLDKRKNSLFLDRKAERSFAKEMVGRLSIKCAGEQVAVKNLSGGNQQKVVLGKELGIEPKVLLFNEPTRGIDIEAKSEFYAIMRKLTSEGVGIIVVSSDLMEVIGICDRVIVLYEGKVSGILAKEEMSEESIMRCAVGLG